MLSSGRLPDCLSYRLLVIEGRVGHESREALPLFGLEGERTGFSPWRLLLRILEHFFSLYWRSWCDIRSGRVRTALEEHNSVIFHLHLIDAFKNLLGKLLDVLLASSTASGL